MMWRRWRVLTLMLSLPLLLLVANVATTGKNRCVQVKT